MLLYFRAQCATDSIQLNNLSNKQWQYTEHHTTSLLWLKVIPVCDWTVVTKKPPRRGWKQENLHILQLKRQGTNWQRKFRLHIPCGVVLFLVQFENSISTTLVFTWKRFSWESSHCLSKGSSVWKGSNSQLSPNKIIWSKKTNSNLFWIFFFPHSAAHPRHSCFLIGMFITGAVIKSCWEMMRHPSKACGKSHNPLSKECSGKISF